MVYDGLDAGDETRRNGDYVGLPHDEDGKGGPVEGELVTFDGNAVTAAAVDGGGGGDDIFGVLYTYQYYGEDNSIRQDRDATVKTHGTAIVDLSDVAASASAGDTLGPNGEVLVLQASDSGEDHYEVLLR